MDLTDSISVLEMVGPTYCMYLIWKHLPHSVLFVNCEVVSIDTTFFFFLFG